MTRPAPTTEAVWRNSRRVTWVWAPISRLLRRAMDGGADPLVGAAAADVRHGGVDVGVAGAPVLGEQRRGGHDLTRLAVAALGHVLGDPGSLHGVAPTWRQPFDRGHALPGGRRDGHHARSYGRAVAMHGAGPALRDAASALRLGDTALARLAQVAQREQHTALVPARVHGRREVRVEDHELPRGLPHAVLGLPRDLLGIAPHDLQQQLLRLLPVALEGDQHRDLV